MLAQIEAEKLVGSSRCKLVLLDIDATHPVSFLLQPFDYVAADKSPCTTDERCFHSGILCKVMGVETSLRNIDSYMSQQRLRENCVSSSRALAVPF